MLPTFELGGVRAGATICHDHYLGLLPRHLAKCRARLWVNPSFDNVTDIKWSSVLRLRAVENRFFALCTLHCDVNKRTRTRPFAFSPHGNELSARQAGSEDVRPVSQCHEAGNIYIVDLDMAEAGKPLDWSKLPPSKKPKRPRKQLREPVRVALKGCIERPDIRRYLTHMPLFVRSRACQPGGASTYVRPSRDGPHGRRQSTTAVAANGAAAQSDFTRWSDDSTAWPNGYPATLGECVRRSVPPHVRARARTLSSTRFRYACGEDQVIRFIIDIQ